MMNWDRTLTMSKVGIGLECRAQREELALPSGSGERCEYLMSTSVCIGPITYFHDLIDCLQL